MIGDCRSVANPGYGLVMTLIGRTGPSIRTDTTAPLVPNLTPICSSFHRNTPKWSSEAPTRLISPPVIAAAIANTPASIRSAITVCSTAVSSSTPCTVMKPVPPPVIRAPILVRNAMTSRTSGSCAVLSITVRPGRQARRHDQVLGAGVRRRVQVQVRALQLAGLDPDGRVALVHDRAEPGEAAVVEVQVPVAQVAPADALDHGLAEPVQQGRHEQHRAAEPAGDLGRQHRAGQVGRVDDQRPFGLVELDDRADRLGQFDGAADVLDRRDVPQHRVAVAGEQGRGDHLQRRVLRALHENRPVQRSASAHAVTRLGSQSHGR